MCRFLQLAVLISLAAFSRAVAQDALPGVPETSSSPQHLKTIGDSLYFAADDGIHGCELWVSNEDGLSRMIADIEPGPGSSNPFQMCGARGLLFFCATTLEHGNEPWVYDRVQRKARILKDIVPGPISSAPIFGGEGTNGLFMLTRGSDTGRHALWTIRLSPVEPVLVAYLPSSLREYPHTILDSGRFFFGVNKGLFCSDGTPPNTGLVFQSEGQLNVQWLTALKDRIVFSADAPDCGNELWVSDGTPGRTHMLKDIRAGEPSSMIAQVYAHQGCVYFQADDGEHGLELWVTDGTPDGTYMVKDIAPGKAGSDPHYFIGIGELVCFAAHDGSSGIELWRTDGTADGTVQVSNLTGNGVAGAIWSPAVLESKVYFCADSSQYGEEVFSYNTKNGTVSLVRDIVPHMSGSGPNNLTPFRRELFFVCNDGIHGEELWATNGTEAGTHMTFDIRRLGAEQSASSSPAELTAFRGKLLFSATEMEHGTELWISDGSNDGTLLLADIASGSDDAAPRDLRVLETQAFFSAESRATGRELYITDGSQSGTMLIRDIYPGPRDSDPRALATAGERLFFTADDGEHGRELWYSDGSPDRTRLVADITPGLSGSDIDTCAVQENTLFVAARDSTGSLKIFHVDTTTLDVRPLAEPFIELAPECAALLSQSGDSWPPSAAREVNGKSFFPIYTAEYGRELWATEDRALEAVLFADLFPGRASSGPTYLTVVGGLLLFIAETPQQGRVLFESDGTPMGTVVCRPIDPSGAPFPPIRVVEMAALGDNSVIVTAPHPILSEIGQIHLHVMSIEDTQAVFQPLAAPPAGCPIPPHQLTSSGGLVYFTCDDGVHGEELWATDGTHEGTRLAKDILASSDALPAAK